jgi:hypothetical protein
LKIVLEDLRILEPPWTIYLMGDAHEPYMMEMPDKKTDEVSGMEE